MEVKRTYFLDFLRIIACFFVIVNHTNSGIFLGSTPEMKRWVISLTYFFVSKIAVPIFFMISGYLLLSKEDTWAKTLRRLLRIVVVLLVCAVIYAAYWTFYKNGGSFMDFAKGIVFVYKTIPSTALWYLYAYLGILLMLPYLQKMTQRMTRRDYHIFFVITGLVVGVLPILRHYSDLFTLNIYLYLPLFGGYIWMLLLGQYFARFGVKKTKMGACIAALVYLLMLVFNVAATYFEYQKSSTDYLFFDNITFLPIVSQSVCVFYLATFLNFGPGAGKLISFVGSCTFGIYLISDLMINVMDPVYVRLSEQIHPLPAVLIFELLVFMIGLTVTAGLKKIPGVKNYL